MKVTIHFLNGNDINTQKHYYEKGYRSDVIVQVDKTYYEVYFYEESVLTYEMYDGDFFSMPGLIILDVIEHDKIVKSIKHLYDMGYFNWFKGFDKMQHNKLFMKNYFANEMSPYDKDTLTSQVIIE